MIIVNHEIFVILMHGLESQNNSGEASPTIYSCYVNFLELMVCKNNQFLKK